MSKQSEAKVRQGYVDKAEPKVCMNCAAYTSEFKEQPNSWGGVYRHETNRRCAFGGFAIKKLGTCSLWAALKRVEG